MKIFALVSTIILLSACGQTQYGNVLRGTIAERGREAAATGLENAEWYICRASPVGAVRDRYGRSQATADAWKILCEGDGDAKILEPIK